MSMNYGNYNYSVYDKYARMEEQYNNQRQTTTTTTTTTTQPTYQQAYQSVPYDYFAAQQLAQQASMNEVSSECTDGKDDGKIGVIGAVGSATKGVVKSAINGVKGMFTDSEGKFSLLKTAGTAIMGAACVAFPALGGIMCGVGTVTGGATLVKGVSTAVNAETDAEAKAAWENIGEGAVTVAGSVMGAKASYGAIKNGSTANALANLDDNATVFQKIGALGKDAWSSTRNSYKNIKGKFVNYKTAHSKYKDAKANLKKTELECKQRNIGDDWIELETDTIDYNLGRKRAEARAILDETKSNTITGKFKSKWNEFAEARKAKRSAKTEYKSAKKAKKASDSYLDDMKKIEELKAKKLKGGLTDSEARMLDNQIKQLETTIKHVDDANVQVAKNAQRLKELQAKQQKANTKGSDVKLTSKESAELAKLQKQASRYVDTKGKTANANFETASQAYKTAKNNTAFGKLTSPLRNSETVSALKNRKDINWEAVKKALGEDKSHLVNFLTSKETTYAQAVQQYGYENVAGVLETLYGMGLTQEIV